MKTLKDYIELQPFTGMTDMEIIVSYFIENNLEEEGMEVSHTLAQSKIKKMKHQLNYIKEWAYYIPSDYLYKNYSLDIATSLHKIELDFIVNGEVTGARFEWAKENMPKLERPAVYFQPCIEWLEERGVKFKEEGMDI